MLLDWACLMRAYGEGGGIPLRVERAVGQQAEGEGIEVVRVEPPRLVQVLPAQEIWSRW